MIAVVEGNLSEVMLRDNLQEYLDAYNASSGKEYSVETSMGIYTADYTEVNDFEELLRKVDQRMYQDKAQRKQRK